jgi:hypothetical protein
MKTYRGEWRYSDGLQGGRMGFDSQQGKRFFFSIQWVPAALSLGVNRQGREADHSPPSSTVLKNNGTIPPLPKMSSWRDY